MPACQIKVNLSVPSIILQTPSHKEQDKSSPLEIIDVQQAQYLTPNVRSSLEECERTSQLTGVDRLKIIYGKEGAQGNLSVISEEKSQWMVESFSAASSKHLAAALTGLNSVYSSAQKFTSSATASLPANNMKRILSQSQVPSTEGAKFQRQNSAGGSSEGNGKKDRLSAGSPCTNNLLLNR